MKDRNLLESGLWEQERGVACLDSQRFSAKSPS